MRLARLLRGDGIEIGALHRPLDVPREARVTYVDRLPVAELREHYMELAGENLTPIDVIGTAEDLSAFPDLSLDFVIANHLIEHVEDPIRALKEFDRVLKPQGLLFLCVPDARVTFDHKRELTTLDHLLAEHRGAPAAVVANRREHYIDWVVNVDDSTAPVQGGCPVLTDSHRERVGALMEMGYSIHFHCWHSDTFLAFFETVRREEGMRLDILGSVDTLPTDGNELVLLAGKEPSREQRRLAQERLDAPTPLVQRLKRRLKASPAGPALVWAYRRAHGRQP